MKMSVTVIWMEGKKVPLCPRLAVACTKQDKGVFVPAFLLGGYVKGKVMQFTQCLGQGDGFLFHSSVLWWVSELLFKVPKRGRHFLWCSMQSPDTCTTNVAWSDHAPVCLLKPIPPQPILQWDFIYGKEFCWLHRTLIQKQAGAVPL